MTFYKDIENLYEKKTYSEKYGGSIFITILILGIFSYIIFRNYFRKKIGDVKKVWGKEKCNPFYMPLAGLVNPQKGVKQLDTISRNFTTCTTDLLTEIIGIALAPANYAAATIVETLKYLANTIDNIRKLFNYIRNRLYEITSQLMNRILNSIIPIISHITHMKTIFAKIAGVATSALYTLIGTIFAIKSALGTLTTLCIIALIIFAAAIIIMWIMPWTWWIAIPWTAFFLMISIPVSIMLYWLVAITGQGTSNSMPANPCFDKHTIIKTKTGDKYIKDIKIGEELLDGSIVTATIKSSIQDAQMYKLHDVLVTGQHFVFLPNEGWVHVKEHPKSERVWLYNEPFVYCLNTTDKRIRIGNNIFLDWDDITDADIAELKKHKSIEHLQQLNGGFVGDTMIEMIDGTFSRMDSIKIGDALKYGIKVVGTVEIDGTKMRNMKKFTINQTTVTGGSNLQIIDKYLGNISTLDINGKDVNKSDKLYHLVTDMKTMTIGNIRFRDYNGALEIYYGEKNNIYSLV